MRSHPYRTVFVAICGMASLTAGLAMCARWPAADAVFPHFAIAIGGCVVSVAAKSYGEHRENAKAVAAGAAPVTPP